jgi:hypothetical protein
MAFLNGREFPKHGSDKNEKKNMFLPFHLEAGRPPMVCMPNPGCGWSKTRPFRLKRKLHIKK